MSSQIISPLNLNPSNTPIPPLPAGWASAQAQAHTNLSPQSTSFLTNTISNHHEEKYTSNPVLHPNTGSVMVNPVPTNLSTNHGTFSPSTQRPPGNMLQESTGRANIITNDATMGKEANNIHALTADYSSNEVNRK
jgi:hypothetical protein